MSQVKVKGIEIKMFDMGWEDAVEGRSPRFLTKNYTEGYEQGKKDIN